ncbi:MATE family efflux transporter [Paenibacillus wynnii]|uniref:Probable multidrug resistance protein NorM n=1 Tax=Paenibacillus wynnii TaxID=268407 RepID=A0A098MCL5_9BACL|nr:MATE family efflux transporter [Paenibacillus wynnii]KGE19776.1 multidrug transporter MatE [Paenibacillus wynnii]
MMEPAVRVKRNSRFLDKYFSGESMDYREIIALFIPILVDQAFIVGLNLVNTAMISSSGVAAISAVNMIDSLNIFLISIFVAVATGGTVVVAQYKGSGNHLMVSNATAGAVSSVSLIALVIGLLGILFHNPLLSLLFGAASPEVMDNARTYLIGSCVSYLGIAVVQAVCGALRGIGRTRASLMLSLIMNLAYVILNVVFINLLNMGVLGMTISINAARYMGALCALFYLFRMDSSLHIRLRDLLIVKVSMLKKIMFIGVPFAAEQVFFNGGKILTQIFIVGLGTYAIAANAIASTYAGLMQVPAGALSLTLITVVGQCMGRRNVADARKFVKSFVWLTSLSFVLMALLIMPLFHPILSLFHPPKEIVGEIFTIVLINAIAQIPLWAISFIMPSGLRAAGDSKYTSMVSMLSMWLFRVVLGYILGIVLDMGLLGFWLAMNCEWGIRGVIFLRRFLGEKWYQHRLI